MKRRWIGAVLLLALAGCSTPQGGLVEPVFNGETGGMAEPVMEPAVVTASAPARVAGPMMRPKARPSWLEHCSPGDDGIGGTGCRVD
jgi:hypothetical protein